MNNLVNTMTPLQQGSLPQLQQSDLSQLQASSLSQLSQSNDANSTTGTVDSPLASEDGSRGVRRKHDDIDDDDSDGDDVPKPEKRAGRRKIKIEYIDDKSRRHITFSKRKAGIMKKAYELSTLTGTQVLLLVVSETGLVYTFTTPKLQPLVTKPEGKNLIQACLNAPDVPQTQERSSTPVRGTSQNIYSTEPSQPIETPDALYSDDRKIPLHPQPPQTPNGMPNANYATLANMGYSNQYGTMHPQVPMPSASIAAANYMTTPNHYSPYAQHAQQMNQYGAPQTSPYVQHSTYWSQSQIPTTNPPTPKISQYGTPNSDKKQ